MSSDRPKRSVPWIILPVVALVSFVFGGWLLSGPVPEQESHTEESEGSEKTTWTCSMHPQIRQPEPGACPICGMDLVPVSSNAAGSPDTEVPRQVALSERAKTLARIGTAEVRRLDAGGVERRLFGRVDYDETSLRTVTAWIGGRIDRLHVGATGQNVKRGQVIATLYSPEVYSAHQDLIQAAQQLKRLQEGATPSAKDAARAALDAARDRLRLIGVPETELRTMESARKPSERVRIRTPFGGTVIERLATQGSYVTTGSGLYRVANLSRLWVQLDAYESDLAALQVGQEVTITGEALSGEPVQGRVTFVDPVLDPKTRTARVRIEVKNKNRKLRPGMFVEATVRAHVEPSDPRLVVPATAPLFTGRRSIVYVEIEDATRPTYEARVVELGAKMGDVYPVKHGLEEGERVVVHGAFAIDADLQIQGGASMMSTDDVDGGSKHDHAAHDHASMSGGDAATLSEKRNGAAKQPKPHIKLPQTDRAMKPSQTNKSAKPSQPTHSTEKRSPTNQSVKPKSSPSTHKAAKPSPTNKATKPPPSNDHSSHHQHHSHH